MKALITALATALVAAPLGADETEDPIIPVTVIEVSADALAPLIPAAGTVHSRNSAQITAGLQARLEWVAEPGELVQAGTPVARFDCADLTLRKEELSALAEVERIRHESLGRQVSRMQRATLATSELQLEQAIADRDLARGAMAVAAVRIRQTENALKRCQALAPFTGVVTRQLHRGGEDVAQGEILAAMTDTQHLEVRASVPIRYLPRVVTGVAAAVRLNELALEGTLRTAVPAADAASQTFEVRINLPAEASRNLAAGQLVSVQLPLAADASLVVPRDAIVLRPEGSFVMRIDEESRAWPIPVEVSDALGSQVSNSRRAESRGSGCRAWSRGHRGR